MPGVGGPATLNGYLFAEVEPPADGSGAAKKVLGEEVIMTEHGRLGARIRQLRGKLLTQRELADRAQVSVDVVRKLEQGQRHTASIGSLQRIARALDVSIDELIGKPAAVPSPDPHAGVVAIRRALTPVDDLIDLAVIEGTPLSLKEAERTVVYLWGGYWGGRYELLSSLLPNALMQLRATYRAVPANQRPQAAEALARANQCAGDTLVHLGQPDAAFLAIREALRIAREGDDPLVSATVRMSVSWHLVEHERRIPTSLRDLALRLGALAE
jgi:transcriptional regulator with XRE-family HTH domain